MLEIGIDFLVIILYNLCNPLSKIVEIVREKMAGENLCMEAMGHL